MWGGEPGCEHEWDTEHIEREMGQKYAVGRGDPRTTIYKADYEHAFCLRCNAWRGSLGLEPTPELYVQHMVEIFREVRRTLRDDGTLFLNLGDSYFGSGPNSQGSGLKHYWGTGETTPYGLGRDTRGQQHAVLKPKDLVGVPWRVAFALQVDGWWLRSAIPWIKKNAMPESVTDRPTTAHEYIFLFSKSKRYFFDKDAIAKLPKLDAIRDLMYNYEHGNEAVYYMQSGFASDGVLPSQGWQEQGSDLQNLREGQNSSMATDVPGARVGTPSECEVQCQPSRESQESRICQDGCTQGIGQEIRPIREGQESGCSLSENDQSEDRGESLCPEREGQGKPQEIPTNPKGTGKLSEGCSQAEGSPRIDHQQPNSGGVGTNTDRPQSCVHVLWEDRPTPHDGSHHPSIKGRTPCERECSTSLPQLQRQEGQQTSGRNRRTSDWWLESLDRLIEQYRDYLLHLKNVRDDGGLLLGEGGGPLGFLVNTKPFKEAHFATFPEKLVEPCIMAGTSLKGQCPECGKGWVRVVEKTGHVNQREPAHVPNNTPSKTDSTGWAPTTVATDRWQPTCKCNAGEPVPQFVLDPFSGAGTTCVVAKKLSRNYVGIELNPDYVEMSLGRLNATPTPLFAF